MGDGSGSASWSSLTGVPDALSDMGEGAKDLLSDPSGYVKGIIINIVSSWIVRGAITVASFVFWALYQPFAITADVWATASSAIIDGTRPAGTAITGAISGTIDSVVPGSAGGPFAALVTWMVYAALAAAMLYVLIQIAILIDPR